MHGTVFGGATVWVDLDNAPHVVTFAPLIRGLEGAGHRVVVTARDVNRTPALARHYGLRPIIVGQAFPKATLLKIAGTIWRSIRLAALIRKSRVLVALSHGSRSQALAAWLLRRQVIVFFDYEGADLRLFRWVGARHYFPDILTDVAFHQMRIPEAMAVPYPGLKEHLALLSPMGDRSELEAAGVPVGRPYAVIRPESDRAHYLPDRDDTLLLAAIEACDRWKLVPVIVPRDEAQRQRLERLLAGLEGIRLLRQPVHGLTLLQKATVLISGGGTMNREAAVIGLPCVSIFRGRMGHIDQALVRQGKITHIVRAEDFTRLGVPTRSPEAIREARGTARRLLDWLLERLQKDIQEISLNIG